jgi:hypothetical protein
MTQPSLFEPRNIAESRARARFHLGEAQKKALVDRVASTVIRDRLVAPLRSAMHFIVEQDSASDPGVMKIEYPNETCTLHQHALGQLAAKVDLPMTFTNRLNKSSESWKKYLLAHNLNELFYNTSFPGERPRFLHRIVGNELRGFLTRRFNRHLASLPMLRAFIEAYEKASAQPVESTATDVRVSLKAYLPHIFEAYPGQFICVGVEWSNSDFGAGKLAVSQTIWDPVRQTRAVLDEPVSRVHLGSVIEDSDIGMSEETMAKEVDTQASAIHDAVSQQLGEEQIERLLRAIKVANEEEIPLGKLRGMWRNILMKKELESLEQLLAKSEVEDLPPPGKNINGEPIPSKWWAAAVLSHIADRTDDEDRRGDLQREAGKLLSMAKEAESGPG